MAFRIELGNSTTKELQQRLLRPATSSMVLTPVGSTEQHGPHLPLDTDTRIATAIADAVTVGLASDNAEVSYLLAPAIAYGAAGEHQDFPGTVSIGTTALITLLVEYGRSACTWVDRVVFVNGHGGNVEALRSAVELLRSEGRDIAWCPLVVPDRGAPDSDAHAGHTETSILLYISPSDVRTEEWCRGNTEPLVSLLPQMRLGGLAAVSDVGVLGDPTTATAADGGLIVRQMVTECQQRIERWAVRPDGMLL